MLTSENPISRKGITKKVNTRRAPWRDWFTTKDAEGKEKTTEFGSWYRDMAQGSTNTSNENARKLAFYCAHVRRLPDQLIEDAKADPRAFAQTLAELCQGLTDQGRAGSYAARYVVVVESWLRFHGLALSRKPKIRGIQYSPTLAEEGAPTQPEIRQLLAACTPRGRVCAALMAFSGVRPEVLGEARGKDGLRLGDFPELRLTGDDTPRFETSPTLVRVRAPLSKTRRAYLTFLPAEGCEAVLFYLRQRLAQGEALTAESPLVPSTETGGFLCTPNISREVREGLKRAGIRARPYVLRVYHSTALLTAESRQGLPHAFAQHWCGHVGDMDARYSVNKGRLPPDLIADMRRRYANACDFLTTTGEIVNEATNRRIADLESRLAGQAKLIEAASARETEVRRLIAEEVRRAMTTA